MPRRILIAVNELLPSHIDCIEEAAEGWAVCDRIPQEAPKAQYRREVKSSEIVIGWPETELVLESDVRFLQLPSVGLDGYLNRGLESKKDFQLCNARGVMSVAMSEHCLAMMYALARQIPAHLCDQRERRWRRQAPYLELDGSTACVIGLGDIGGEIARRLQAIGMRVIAVSASHATTGHPHAEQVLAPERLKEALSQADHVVLIRPAMPDGRALLTSDAVAAIKPGAFFYNLARGNLVDEVALIDALKSGHIAGAGLDVFAQEPLPTESPLWEMENVIVTPHVGGRSVKEFDRLCALFVENLGRYRRGEELKHRVL
jgi:D-2-hydroxyacid dehydrogenase (NADP+)